MAKKQQFKRILAVVFVFVFAFASITRTVRAACAEGEDNSDSVTSMTLEEYEAGVLQAADVLSGYLQDDLLMEKIRSAYFLVNYTYISEELYLQLVEKGYITEIDLLDDEGILTRNNPDGWINIDNVRALKGAINDYNEIQITIDYFSDTMDMSHYIDPSVFCADGHDREVVHRLYEKWFNGYDLSTQTSIRDNESFREAHELLFSLPVAAKPNAEVSVGAAWLVYQTTGENMMGFIKNYLLSNYSYAELEQYFHPEGLPYADFNPRNDFEFDLDNMSDMEYLVYCYVQEWFLCLQFAHEEMFAVLNADELVRQGE